MSRLLQTARDLERALPALADAQSLAVDTEFHTERRRLPELMLVQIRADDADPVLIDPLAGLDLTVLGPILGSVPVVVHGGATDAQILARALGTAPNIVFDTQIAAACVGDGYPVRLQDLAWKHLRVRLDKTWTLSDWARRPLSDRQLGYAAEDVLVLGDLRRALTERLVERGTTAIADAYLAEQLKAALAPSADGDAWRTLPGVHLLDGEERAVLQALAAWRQQASRERDVPRHNVLGDALLLDIVRRRPTTLDALRANRRMPSSVHKRDGEGIIAIVRSLSGVSLPPPHPYNRVWAEVARAAGRGIELETGISIDLLLDPPTLSVLARGERPDNWRARYLGDEFMAFLDGKRGMWMPAGIKRGEDS